jgi:hypothetical protein
MTAWKILGSLAIVLASVSGARAQGIALQEAPLAGSYFHIKLHMDLSGELKIRQENKITPLKQQARADHDFLERVLEADEGGPIRKAARAYREACADITTGSQVCKSSLRPERALIVAQCYKEQPLSYCPKGPLTRAELEVVQHFDTLHLPGLLPGKEVAVGATWKLSNATAQALCAFDGLTSHDLIGKLEAVKDGAAVISLSGTAAGIDLGASVKLKIAGSCRFDLKQHRLVWLQWKQHDERDQGPASPALAADLTITMERTPIEPANELNDLILKALLPTDATPPENMTALWHRDQKGRYELTYDRAWQLVANTDDYLVLRLLDRGEFVAQATLTWWTPAPAGAKHMTEEDFQKAMAEAPGWEQKEVVDAKVIEAPSGQWLYRLQATGKLNGLDTLQYFYLLAGPHGEQLVIAFALTPIQAQTLGSRDLALVHGIVFPEVTTGARTD